MSSYKLTKEYAEILDEVIHFMCDDKHNNKGENRQFNNMLFQISRVANKKGKISDELLDGILHIGDICLPENQKRPYSGNLSHLVPTDSIYSFREMGGYKEVWENQNKIEIYTEELRLSTIATNKSVRKTNTKTIWIASLAAVLSLTTLFETIYKDLLQDTKPKDKQLQMQKQALDNLDKTLKKIDSSIQKLAKDSSKSP